MAAQATKVAEGWVEQFDGNEDGVQYAHMATLAAGPSAAVVLAQEPNAARKCNVCGEALPPAGHEHRHGNHDEGGDQEVGPPAIFAAFQASAGGAEGLPGQHIRFTRSLDGGATFERSRAVVFNALTPAWSPVLHYDGAVLYLFYTESCKHVSPGGDVKLKRSTDNGRTWSVPQLVYSHDEEGGVPKVLANKLCILRNVKCAGEERWLLPFWREPVNQWKRQHTPGGEGTDKQYHPMMDAEAERDGLTSNSATAGMPCDHGAAGAGVLVSDDRGKTWSARGFILAPPEDGTWLIENAAFAMPKQRRVVARERDDAPAFYSAQIVHQIFRSSVGVAYISTSHDDGMTWAPSRPLPSVPNPNSKLSACTVPRGEDGLLSVGVLAYNPSATRRAPLHLAMSVDPPNAASWCTACEVEADPDGHFAYPTVCMLEGGGGYYERLRYPLLRRRVDEGAPTVGVAYSVWKTGIKFSAFTFEKGFEKALHERPKPGRFQLTTFGDSRIDGDFLAYRDA